jgi:type VI secretion system protein ImpM
MAEHGSVVAGGSVGFFGKVPTHGDFVHRGLPADFVQAWDPCMSAILAGSQQVLGDRWLARYLYSPIWRFVLEEGVVTASVWAGVIVPSVDRVGRCFPLTIAAPWPSGTSLTGLASDGDGWFAGIERLALQVLEAEEMDLDGFQQRLEALQAPARHRGPPAAGISPDAWAGTWSADRLLTDALLLDLDSRMRAALSPTALWWRAPNTGTPGEWLARRGLPDTATYLHLLGEADTSAPDGDALTRADLLADAAPAAGPTTVGPRDASPLRFAGITHPGHQRADNQDAWLADAGCWVVADGMGGHENGALASRTVIEHVRKALIGRSALESRSEAVLNALRDANSCLRTRDGAAPATFSGGSTVVALLLEGPLGEVLWAGDSRLYRWRAADATLHLLTRDHVPDHAAGTANHAITRAVGGDDVLDVDRLRFEVSPGDRFLLCSDGVHGLIPDEALATLIRQPADPASICSALARAVLAGPAPDNLTAVVVVAG